MQSVLTFRTRCLYLGAILAYDKKTCFGEVGLKVSQKKLILKIKFRHRINGYSYAP
jgi:hypothetical protein